MRCCFIRGDQIEFVERLRPGSDDELLRQAMALAARQTALPWNRFEIWDGKRLVYRSPARPLKDPPK